MYLAPFSPEDLQMVLTRSEMETPHSFTENSPGKLLQSKHALKNSGADFIYGYIGGQFFEFVKKKKNAP